MRDLLDRGQHAIDSLNEWVGRTVAWLTLAMVVVTFLVVVLRYVFQMGSIAVQESILYMHAVVFLCGAAFTLKREGHVRVDIFYRGMSPRGRALVDLIGVLLFLLPTCVFILVVSWRYVSESWQVMEGSREAGGLPGVFLLKTTILIMATLLVLQGIAQLLKGLLTIMPSRA
jgi:TRAP-type mannitol/chloroaromatic compound transport system permease small subunit